MQNIELHLHPNYELDFDQNLFMQYFNKFLNNAGRSLNLNGLTDIFFTKNYKKEIAEFNNKFNLNYTITDNQYGKGSAMLSHYNDNYGQEKLAIFYHPYYVELFYFFNRYDAAEAENLLLKYEFKNSNNVKKMIYNHIYHELVHVHDMNIFNKLIEDLSKEEKDMFRIGLSFWSEYHAHFLSGKKYPYETIESIRKDFEKNIILINQGHYPLKGMEMIIRNIGDLHAIGKNILNIIGNGNYIFQRLINIDIELQKLELKYPNWNNIDILDKLQLLIDRNIN